jgi:hypothetical protein
MTYKTVSISFPLLLFFFTSHCLAITVPVNNIGTLGGGESRVYSVNSAGEATGWSRIIVSNVSYRHYIVKKRSIWIK